METAQNMYRILGPIEKSVNLKGKTTGFSVKLEITFPSGEKRPYAYTAQRKKELEQDLQNGKLGKWINCAMIDSHSGNLVFQLSLY